MRTIAELMNMGGRVTAITGGAGHIGLAAAEAVAEAGSAVVLVDLDAESCERHAKAIAERFKVETLPLAVDISTDASAVGISGRIIERFGRLDGLIHSAALVGTSELSGWAVPFSQQSRDTFRKALEVNLTSVFSITQACAGALAASGHGSVISVVSTYGLVGPDMRIYEGTQLGNPAAYAASKGGLLQLTRWLATVLAPKVRVNAISPGGIVRGQPEAFRKNYDARTPLGRMGTEEELKGAFLYLASDLSQYVTGANLVVDGGWTAW